MSRPRSFVVAFVAAAALASAGTAGAYHTRFVADNCNINPPQPTSYITREGSTTVALRARYEGYQWAGGYLPSYTRRWCLDERQPLTSWQLPPD